MSASSLDPRDSDALASAARSAFPNGRLAVMDNCGHWPQYEDTDTFNRLHLDFLLEGTDRS